MKKEVIYIDVEDDITAIIDKIKASAEKIVALVPPKRASVLQSVVNMKLLKRTGQESNKRLVLITSQQPLISLAGGVGLHVAKNLQSKPEIPHIAGMIEDDGEDIIRGSDEPLSARKQSTKAGGHKPKGNSSRPEGHDADEPDDGALEEASVAAAQAPKATKGKKAKVPNFQNFRTKMLIGGTLLILLIVGWFVAFFIMPRATVSLKAQTTKVPTQFDFTADASLTDSDTGQKVLAAEAKEIKKTLSESFTPSGEKNIGAKASGQMTVRNCDSSSAIQVPAGTLFTAKGLSFSSNEAAAVPGGSFSGGSCSTPGETTVTVTASDPGDQFNLAAGTGYAVQGFSSLVTGVGGQMSGGTTQIVKVVQQKDVDEAKKRLEERDTNDVKTELKEQFGDSVVLIDESFSVSVSEITSDPGVGQQAENARVTAVFTFTQLGVRKDTFTEVVEGEQKSKIDEEKQSIYKNGIDEASLKVLERVSSGKVIVRYTGTGYIGPKIDKDAFAKSIKGKRYSQIIDSGKQLPGVTDVSVEFSPFWVFSAPRPSRTTINLEVADQVAQ